MLPYEYIAPLMFVSFVAILGTIGAIVLDLRANRSAKQPGSSQK